MFDPRALADPSIAEGVVAEFLPDPRHRLVALRQLVTSADYAATVAPAAWGVTLYRDIFRLNVGMVEVLVAGEDHIRFNCVGMRGVEPFVGPRFQMADYRSVPNPKCAFVGPIQKFAEVSASLQAPHRRFIDTVGRRKSGEPVAGSRMTKSHCEGLITYARAFIASPDRSGGATSYWTAGDESSSGTPYIEGGRIALQVNAFERSSAARARCIEHHGRSCVICGFNSRDTYGEDVEGLIHVHHIRPLSEIGESYVVDPISDLRPVCPNCHAVIHSRNPQYSLDEVATLLKTGGRRKRSLW